VDLFIILSVVASLVSLLYALWPNFTHQQVKHRKLAWIFLTAFLLISSVLYFFETENSDRGIISQAGTVEVSNRSKNIFEVFYPKKYLSPPNLKLTIVKGHGNLEIIEQRADGFKFETYELGYEVMDGSYIDWLASGEVSVR
jgi:hypothetical protein